MRNAASDLSGRLSRNAEAVCRRYLSKGRREGAYWTVGDVMNTPGRSLHVRLTGPERGPGAAGHWADEASGEHGDLLDLIGLACGLTRLKDVLDEARSFLALPIPPPLPEDHHSSSRPRSRGSSPEKGRRLFRAGQALPGTLAARYLRSRDLDALDAPALRFHPQVFLRPVKDGPLATMPALLAAVTDLAGTVMGVHRTWLDPATGGKARLDTPRRSMGHLLGNGVRFGVASDVLAAGEGLETMLSLRTVLPTLPAVAATSANHLAVLELPPGLKRLYVARERDRAGLAAADRLLKRAREAGAEVSIIDASGSDLNDDLLALGRAGLLDAVRDQLAPEDRERFAHGLAETGVGNGSRQGSPCRVAADAHSVPSSDRESAAPTAF